MFKHTDVPRLRQADLEDDLRGIVIRCDFDQGRHTAKVFPNGMCADLLP